VSSCTPEGVIERLTAERSPRCGFLRRSPFRSPSLVRHADFPPEGVASDGRARPVDQEGADESIPVGPRAEELWIPLVLIVVLAIRFWSCPVCTRCSLPHDSTPRRLRHRDVQFTRSHGPTRAWLPGSNAQIAIRPGCERHSVNLTLPWSITCSTTLRRRASPWRGPMVGRFGCRVTVKDRREEHSANGVNAQTCCLGKSA